MLQKIAFFLLGFILLGCTSSSDSNSAGQINFCSGGEYRVGAVVVNESSDFSLELTNQGEGAVSFFQFSPLIAPFAFKGGSYPGTGGSCGDSLGAGASCSVVITFSPTVYQRLTFPFFLQYPADGDIQILQCNFIASGKGVSGALDTTFDTDGKKTIVMGTGGNEVTDMAIQSDGKMIFVGVGSNGSNNDYAITRLLTNGDLDPAFSTDGKLLVPIGSADDAANSIAIQSDGKIVVFGTSIVSADLDFSMIRLETDGSLDTAFSSDGKVIFTAKTGSYEDMAEQVFVQTDGKIIVGGYVNDDFALVRLLSNGSLDTSFSSDGRVNTDTSSDIDTVTGMDVFSDGKAVLFGIVGENQDLGFVRYQTDGSLDTAFNSTGKKITRIAETDHIGGDIKIQSDGKIVGVFSYPVGDTYGNGMVRLNTNGSLDSTFDTDGFVRVLSTTYTDYSTGVDVQSDGKILVGLQYPIFPTYHYGIARYLSNGTLDTSFNSTSGLTTVSLLSGDDFLMGIKVNDDHIYGFGRSVQSSDNLFSIARVWQ